MFEQIVRPFQSRTVIARRRIVPSVSDGSDTGTAVLSWGAAGTIEQGAKQEEGEDLAEVGFNIRCCDDTWEQKGEPVREETKAPVYSAGTENQIGETTYSRVQEIQFQSKNRSGCNWGPSNVYVASAIAESIAGWEAAIPMSQNCNSRFKLRYSDG